MAAQARKTLPDTSIILDEACKVVPIRLGSPTHNAAY